MVDKAERDANLDALKTTFDEWVDRRIKREEEKVKFLKNVLDSRGATERIQNDVLNKLTVVAETDLNRLLTG